MINHARTLLLNKSANNYQPDTLGEEYVPAGYSALTAPDCVQTPYRIIFGTNPDKVFLNYRLHELLNLIHNTELNEFLYKFDSRVTYWPRLAKPFFSGGIRGVLSKVGGYDLSRLAIVGAVTANNILGMAMHEYVIKVTYENNEEHALVTEVAKNETVSVPISWVAGFNNGGPSNLISLPGTDLLIQFSSVVPTTVYQLQLEEDPGYLLLENGDRIALTVGTDSMPLMYQPVEAMNAEILAQWYLQVYAQPNNAVSDILPKLAALGEPLFLELFGLGNSEPLQTFRNIWFEHPISAYRLAAFVLAMIYRMEARRTGL